MGSRKITAIIPCFHQTAFKARNIQENLLKFDKESWVMRRWVGV
jgi:hypothetical protein